MLKFLSNDEDYKYLLSAMQSHPERLLGVFVADPSVADPETWMEDITKSHKNWVSWSCERNAGINIDQYCMERDDSVYPVSICNVGALVWGHLSSIVNIFRKQMTSLRCLFESLEWCNNIPAAIEWMNVIKSFRLCRERWQKRLSTVNPLGQPEQPFPSTSDHATGRCALQSLQVARRSWHGWRCWETIATWLHWGDVGYGMNLLLSVQVLHLHPSKTPNPIFADCLCWKVSIRQ